MVCRGEQDVSATSMREDFYQRTEAEKGRQKCAKEAQVVIGGIWSSSEMAHHTDPE